MRSKYLQIEILRYLFQYRYEVCIFLRKVSNVSRTFYERFQDELMMLFKEYTILIQPPMKLDMNFASIDAAQNVNDFLDRKVQNFRKLLRHQDFMG